MQKSDQTGFKSNLSEIEKGNKKKKVDQNSKKSALCNIEMLYKARKNFVKFFDDYSSMLSKAKHEATKGSGLKILIPKQILQRLTIALAQVKAGNNLDNLVKLFLHCIN